MSHEEYGAIRTYKQASKQLPWTLERADRTCLKFIVRAPVAGGRGTEGALDQDIAAAAAGTAAAADHDVERAIGEELRGLAAALGADTTAAADRLQNDAVGVVAVLVFAQALITNAVTASGFSPPRVHDASLMPVLPAQAVPAHAEELSVSHADEPRP